MSDRATRDRQRAERSLALARRQLDVAESEIVDLRLAVHTLKLENAVLKGNAAEPPPDGPTIETTAVEAWTC